MSISKSNNIQAYLRDFASAIRLTNSSYSGTLINPQNFTECFSLADATSLYNDLSYVSSIGATVSIEEYNRIHSTSYLGFKTTQLFSESSPVQSSMIKKDATVLGVTGIVETGGYNPNVLVDRTESIYDLSSCSFSTIDKGVFCNYGAWSFLNFSNNSMTTLNLPSTITQINSYAFYSGSGYSIYYCRSLNTVNGLSSCSSFTIGDYAFYSCPLSSIDLSKCTSIGSRAFYYTNLSSTINLNKCVNIGSYAFAFTFKDNSVSLNLPSCTVINDGAFLVGTTTYSGVGYASMPAVITISNSAFYSNRYLSYVYAPNCTTIGNSAFYNIGSANWLNASFPNVTYIGDYAFYRTYFNSSTLSFPNLVSVGAGAFKSCVFSNYYNDELKLNLPNLEYIANAPATSLGTFYRQGVFEVSLPKVTSIGSYAFYDCYSLFALNIPSCTHIGTSAFTMSSFYSPQPLNIVAYNSIFGPYTYSRIGSDTLPKLKIIDNYAFSNHSGLDTAVFNASFTFSSLETGYYIGYGAFSSCTHLTAIRFNYGHGTIGYNAFRDCDELETLIINNVYTRKSLTLYSTDAFYNTPLSGNYNGRIYVPSESLNYYKNASYWSYYSSHIFSISTSSFRTNQGSSFTYKHNMTWREFINSSYNTSNTFRLSNNWVIVSSGYYVYYATVDANFRFATADNLVIQESYYMIGTQPQNFSMIIGSNWFSDFSSRTYSNASMLYGMTWRDWIDSPYFSLPYVESSRYLRVNVYYNSTSYATIPGRLYSSTGKEYVNERGIAYSGTVQLRNYSIISGSTYTF